MDIPTAWHSGTRARDHQALQALEPASMSHGCCARRRGNCAASVGQPLHLSPEDFVEEVDCRCRFVAAAAAVRATAVL